MNECGMNSEWEFTFKDEVGHGEGLTKEVYSSIRIPQFSFCLKSCSGMISIFGKENLWKDQTMKWYALIRQKVSFQSLMEILKNLEY